MGKMDIIVYGATGFTGSLVAKYLSKVSGLRWAVCGRNFEKLEGLAASLAGSASPPEDLVVASPTTEPGDALKIARAATVCLSTAGPFSLYSDGVVRACASEGTSYVDIDGEIPWVKRVILRDDAAAKASGAVIVPNCGFDSIPSDLGVFLATREHGPRRLEGHASMTGAMSGGTIATGILMSQTYPDEIGDPFLIGGAGDPDTNADVTEPARAPAPASPFKVETSRVPLKGDGAKRASSDPAMIARTREVPDR